MVLRITPSERAALQLLARGAAINTLADRLGKKEDEVETHLATLFARMGAANRTEALAAASRRGLLIADDGAR